MFCRKMLPVVLVVLLVLNGSTLPRPITETPRLTLWAWERPEQLDFLASHNVGVAFLAGSISLNADPVLRRRFQPLHVDPKTPLIAVVRIQGNPSTPSSFSDIYRAQVLREILSVAVLPSSRGLQIDFDARRSQRAFYRQLLSDLRPRLPAGISLSITALGSWCLDDDWIADLPVVEAVPMLFRMGVDRANIVRVLGSGRDFSDPLCRSSVGVSIDEPWPEPLLGRHVYVFNTRPWDEETFAAVERKLQP